ncbi:MAG: tetratricopeptide repeat protein [Candidatus Obscuribacterales bacterium]|nr:tetratricopeptide repeat protein [Candidatus Obscuribacterales bacterium]
MFFLAAIFFFSPTAQAEGFPGQGDAADWSDALPHYNLGNRYLEHGRYDDAARKYGEAIDIYAYDPDFYSNLGMAYCKLNDGAKAESAFKKALQLNNKDWMLWNNLGAAYLKQNKLKDTLLSFEQALKLKPPAADQTKIRKDIADLKKILTAQGLIETPAKAKVQTKKVATATAAKKVTLAKPALPNLNKQVDLKDSGWDYVK